MPFDQKSDRNFDLKSQTNTKFRGEIVLITGAAGFIGSHLCAAYLQDGYTVIGLDNYSTGTKENISYLEQNYNEQTNAINSVKIPETSRVTNTKKFLFIEADICNFSVEDFNHFLKLNLLNTKKIKYVFHFASPASPIHYNKLNLETLRVNSLGLQNALDMADVANARLVFASTSEIYGDPAEHPQPESYYGNVNSFGPRSCYNEAKRFGEALIYNHNQRKQTRHGLVRIFNTYGPRMQHDDGRVIPAFITSALANQPLVIHGDGQQTRSFCYIDDLIQGILLYADSAVCDPINLGNDTEISVFDLAKNIIELTHSKSAIEFYPASAEDPQRRRPDLEKAIDQLGYRPQISLAIGLARTSDYLK